MVFASSGLKVRIVAVTSSSVSVHWPVSVRSHHQYCDLCLSALLPNMDLQMVQRRRMESLIIESRTEVLNSCPITGRQVLLLRDISNVSVLEHPLPRECSCFSLSCFSENKNKTQWHWHKGVNTQTDFLGLQGLWGKHLAVGGHMDSQTKAKFPTKFCQHPQTLEVKKNPQCIHGFSQMNLLYPRRVVLSSGSCSRLLWEDLTVYWGSFGSHNLVVWIIPAW